MNYYTDKTGRVLGKERALLKGETPATEADFLAQERAFEDKQAAAEKTLKEDNGG